MESLGHLPLVPDIGSSSDFLLFQIYSLRPMHMDFRMSPGYSSHA